MQTVIDLPPSIRIANARRELVARLQAGYTPEEIAAFISAHPLAEALSREVEDKAEPGTFVAAVFEILCDS